MKIAIHGSGPGVPLAALAFSRLGLSGVIVQPMVGPPPAAEPNGGESGPAGTSTRSVAVNPFAATILRRWDLADCLEVTPTGALVHVRQLERDAHRRLGGFGRFETTNAAPQNIRCTVDVEREAALSVSGPRVCADNSAGISADSDALVTVGISQGVESALLRLERIVWRVAAHQRGWLQLREPGGERRPAPLALVSADANPFQLADLFDVRFTLVTFPERGGDPAQGGPLGSRGEPESSWQAAVRTCADRVPLDLLTVGPGGRVASKAVAGLESIGLVPGGAVLVAPDGFEVQRWASVDDPVTAIRTALQGAGVLFAADG